MAKVVDLPIGAKFKFPQGTGVYEETLFYVSHISDNKSWVEAQFVEPSDICLQLSPDFDVVPYYD